MLAFAAVLGLAQIVAASHAGSLQRGYRWTAGPRDEPVEPLRGVAGRLERALRNYLETFPCSPPSWPPTEWDAALPLRPPALRRRPPLVRSLVWNVSTVGIALIFLALFVAP